MATLPAYGSNVANFDPNNATHKALADAGQAWAKANAAGDAAGMAAAAAQGEAIRAQSGNTSYDPKAGITTFKPTITTASNPTTTGPSSNDLISSIYNNQLNSQMEGLRKARDTALQGLNSVETQAKQGAAANRDSADVVAAQNAQRLREMMAAQGLTASGDNITANSNLNAQRQTAMNTINQGEQNTLTDVSERRALINNNAAGDELSLMQQLQAARDNMLLQQLNADRAFALQESGVTGSYNGNRTLAGQQFDFGKQMDLAGLTGNFNGQRTLQGQAFDVQKAQQDWDNNFKQGQFDWQKAQQTWENAFQEKNFEQSVKDAAASRGLQWASLNQRQQEFIADQAFRNKQLQTEQGKVQFANMQQQLENGLNIYKTTGQMPDYMNQFGIDVNGLSNPNVKDDLEAMYNLISSKQANPSDLLKTIDDKVKLGLESKENGDYLKNAIYKLDPALDPNAPKQSFTDSLMIWNTPGFKWLFK